MKLEKVLKREEKNKKRFFILMATLFFLLPLVLFLSGIKSIFILGFLGVIEALIILCSIIKLNFYKLNFTCSNNRLRFKSGIFSKEGLLICDKVAIVHTTKCEEDIELIIVTTINVKNKMLRPIGNVFLKKYPEAAHEYLRLKNIYPDNIYYYQVIKKGALRKYLLLDTLFKNCVRSVFTDGAIENIKISRGQSEL
ncbi:MAG: hypothetical protein RR620_10750 [Clostridium sp.]